jgi:hypothetical protein
VTAVFYTFIAIVLFCAVPMVLFTALLVFFGGPRR